MSVQLPHAVGSPSFRSSLAAALSTTRRRRPRVPFWQVPAHRVPTLRLYRALLRHSTTENIRGRISHFFRENQYLTSTSEVKQVLRTAYKLLDSFRLSLSDPKTKKILARYDRILEAQNNKTRWLKQEQDALDWIHRLRNRPILTGAFMHSSIALPPLPRMKPQPPAISGMMRYRLRKYEEKTQKRERISSLVADLKHEADFESRLIAPKQQFFQPFMSQWAAPLHAEYKFHQAWLTAAINRGKSTFSQPLFNQIIQARRDKIANKTKERNRERAGEILKGTAKRSATGPPAHVLAKFSPRQKQFAKDIRMGVSQVGCHGMVKSRKGMNLEPRERQSRKTDRGEETWSVLDGRWVNATDEKRLDRRWVEIAEENHRRQQAANKAESLDS
ncbi:hypothetical protein BDZ89DRAFT_137027 [Hymenopellis radicata]|nr:hypothetical protein BDZ89DRAFT_137027 [Hymenopellis radicata]